MSRSNSKDKSGTKGLSLDMAIKELRTTCQNAISYITSELEENWHTAERYYNGESDIPNVPGRSNVVKTEFRDAVRNAMPSIMRTLLHSRKPVKYHPSSIQHSQWVEQQEEYVLQLFLQCGGYLQLYNAILEALKLKTGYLKVSWEEDPLPVYEEYTKVPFNIIEGLVADPQFEIDEYDAATDEGETPLYNVSGNRSFSNGRIIFEAIPNFEVFISRNVNSIEQALEMGVHGHKSVMSVAAAEAMGLKYRDWLKIDDEDPEQSDHTSSSTARRRYNKESPNSKASIDLTARKVTIHEVFVSYDLEGTGRPQIYKFYLGGSSFKYIQHEQVQDSNLCVIVPNPRPFTVHGDSLFDLTVQEQDTSTSLLRATVDNVHMSNNARFAADPNRTSFEDLYNPAMNAPIRKQSGDTLQVVQTPYTGQGNLQLLQYLDMDIQNKVGITKAAQGLDPDAMQSTDKDAVLNTIMTSQGQTELMVRNIIETGLIRAFKLMLRLSVQHMDRVQLLRTKGKFIPIDITMFDPEALAEPNVGLGTASPQQRQAALTFIRQDQQMILDKFGPNNPFTSYAQLYNTTEDLLEANGIYNTHRYYNIVTPEVEKQWAEAEAKKRAEMEKQAQENQPLDPTKAFVTVESGKLKNKAAADAMDNAIEHKKLQLQSLVKQEDLDLERDKLVQNRVIELAKIQQQEKSADIKEEQNANNKSLGGSRGNSPSSKAVAKE